MTSRDYLPYFIKFHFFVFSVSDTRRNLELLYPAIVSNDGTVRWNTPNILRSSCTLDVTYFPWDEQQCKLEFGSWTYDGNSLDITNNSHTGVMDFFLNDGEWEFTAFPAYRRVEYYPDPYPSVIFTVTLKRKPMYYLFNIALPCVFITFCGMLVFLLPPDSGEKVSMSVTLLLASTVFLLLVSEIMPPQSDVIPLIGKSHTLMFQFWTLHYLCVRRFFSDLLSYSVTGLLISIPAKLQLATF